MVTVYHRIVGVGNTEHAPTPEELELVAVVTDTEDAGEAFARTIHDEGDPWTLNPHVIVIGEARGKRSSHDGDVFVTGHGIAHVALPVGFRPLVGLRLPHMAEECV